jgi:hypothetical protein
MLRSGGLNEEPPAFRSSLEKSIAGIAAEV